ncbi:MAG: hypothetical protein Q7P63_13390 [Verrucomicrobiota bacterium JB022]|nr:hypothetical protein [Verrucomicrobiota bacterium JB022]
MTREQKLAKRRSLIANISREELLVKVLRESSDPKLRSIVANGQIDRDLSRQVTLEIAGLEPKAS